MRLPPSVQASQRLAEEYSAKSAAYARCWAPVLRPMALRLLAELPFAAAEYVLDLGSGTESLLGETMRDFGRVVEISSTEAIKQAVVAGQHTTARDNYALL